MKLPNGTIVMDGTHELRGRVRGGRLVVACVWCEVGWAALDEAVRR